MTLRKIKQYPDLGSNGRYNHKIRSQACELIEQPDDFSIAFPKLLFESHARLPIPGQPGPVQFRSHGGDYPREQHNP